MPNHEQVPQEPEVPMQDAATPIDETPPQPGVTFVLEPGNSWIARSLARGAGVQPPARHDKPIERAQQENGNPRGGRGRS